MVDCGVVAWLRGDFGTQGDTVAKPATRAGDVYKSGFFYIEGTFYNDLSHEGNIDYSEVVRNWACPARGVGPFDTGSHLPPVTGVVGSGSLNCFIPIHA